MKKFFQLTYKYGQISMMKKILILLLLNLIFTNNVYSEEKLNKEQLNNFLKEIRKIKPDNSFQIDGINLGSSLTKIYTRESIKELSTNPWPNKTYYEAQIMSEENSKFDFYRIALKTNDDKFIVHAVTGGNWIENNNDCKKKISDHEQRTNKIYSIVNKKTVTNNHPADKSGKSKMIQTRYFFHAPTVKALVISSCYIWSKETGYNSTVDLSYNLEDFGKWLATKAYK